MYYAGLGIPQDYGKAVQWYQKAAEQGHPLAQFGLGAMYAGGQGVPKDRAKAEQLVQASGLGNKVENKGGSKCFIASAIYGPSALETNILRKWRDDNLLPHLPGRLLTHFYYFVSPSLCKLIVHYEKLNRITRSLLDHFIARITR